MSSSGVWSVPRGRSWLVVVGVLGLVASLLAVGVAPPAGAVAGEVDNEAQFSACVGPALESQGLVDIEGSFAEDAVNCLAHFNVTRGRTETLYDPGAPVLRWQMALFLSRAAPSAGVTLPATPADDFTDLGEASDDTRAAINQMAALDIMPGFSGSTFAPNVNVTRAQMASMLDAFLGRAALGAGALGGDVFKLDDVSPDDEVFGDIGQVTRGEYAAIRRMFEAGVAQGTSDDAFNPGGLVTRAQMAVFITRMLAHTAARPVGLNLQVSESAVTTNEAVELAVSVRGPDLMALPDQQVDVFYATDAGEAFGEDGKCVEDAVTLITPGMVCEVTASDERTDPLGDLLLTHNVGPDSKTVWAWTGDVGDVYDADDVTAPSVEISVTKPGEKLMVSDDLAESATRAKFGASVTFTVQVVDEDGEAVALEGVSFTAQATEFTLSGAAGSEATQVGGGRTHTTDEDGKVELSYRLSDPRSGSTGDQAWLDLDISNGRHSSRPAGFLLDDKSTLKKAGNEAGTTADDAAVVWSDATASASVLKLTQAVEYHEASNTRPGAPNMVLATLTDQYGDGVSRQQIHFTSDDPAGIDAAGDNGLVYDPAGSADGMIRQFTAASIVSLNTGVRTTNRSGQTTMAYNRQSAESGIETILARTVVGAGTSAAKTIEADRVYHYWGVEVSKDGAAEGRILVADTENKRLVVAGTAGVHLITYDNNDHFTTTSPATMSEFEEFLEDDEDPAAYASVSSYKTDSRAVSQITAEVEKLGAGLDSAVEPAGVFAVHDGVLVVGAPDEGAGLCDHDSDPATDDQPCASAGKVYVYPNGLATDAADVVELTAPAPAAGQRFGRTVDIGGNTIVVGSAGTTGVYIYERGSGAWADLSSPTANIGAGSDGWGAPLAISGDGSTIVGGLADAGKQLAVVGIDISSQTWADHQLVVDSESIGWDHNATLRSANYATGDLAGLTAGGYGNHANPGPTSDRGIAISEDGATVAAGACVTPDYATPCGEGTEGAVLVWTRPGNTGVNAGWLEANPGTSISKAILRAAGGAKASQDMGKSVAISEDGSVIAASAHYNLTAGEAGVAYVFTEPAGGWAITVVADSPRTADATLSVEGDDEGLGQYIAISSDGSKVAAGRPLRQEGDFRGSVAVFERSGTSWADDNSPAEDLLGAAPNARLGWGLDYDLESDTLYIGAQNTADDDMQSTIYSLTG